METNQFLPLISSRESVALRHMFAAERQGKKLVDPTCKTATAKRIQSVGIVGAGLMGGGIAMCCANVGMRVIILDIDQVGCCGYCRFSSLYHCC